VQSDPDVSAHLNEISALISDNPVLKHAIPANSRVLIAEDQLINMAVLK